jgi:uncharacterized protein YjbI with pentapeptide repeats
MNSMTTREHPFSLWQNSSPTEILQALKQGRSFANANLQGIDLTAMDLSGVDLSGANLIGANLSSVNLSYANLQAADLRGAIAIAANL